MQIINTTFNQLEEITYAPAGLDMADWVFPNFQTYRVEVSDGWKWQASYETITRIRNWVSQQLELESILQAVRDGLPTERYQDLLKRFNAAYVKTTSLGDPKLAKHKLLEVLASMGYGLKQEGSGYIVYSPALEQEAVKDKLQAALAGLLEALEVASTAAKDCELAGWEPQGLSPEQADLWKWLSGKPNN